MKPRRKLSAVLLESERITAEDVERALEHQREHGGYFGQALVELGLVRREEIEWALASQLDLPFIFPDAESADPRATRLVTPDWALAHLAVPYVRTGEALTVVAADPLHYETLDALKARTGLEVEMALATPARIRELIRAVYAPADAGHRPGGDTGEAGDSGEAPTTTLGDLVTEALARGADRLGVSVRGTRAQGWYVAGEARERRRLEDGWEAELEMLLDPWPPPADDEATRPFDGTLHRPGGGLPVEAWMVANLSGSELVLRPRRDGAASAPPPGSLPTGIRADLRLLASAGGARIGVAGEAWRVDGTLPSLPALVLGDDARAAHIAVEADVPGVYTLQAQDGPAFPALLEACGFDALTVDLPHDDGRLPAILATAPLSFARVPEDPDPGALQAAGIGWVLVVGGSASDAVRAGAGTASSPGSNDGWDLWAVVR